MCGLNAITKKIVLDPLFNLMYTQKQMKPSFVKFLNSPVPTNDDLFTKDHQYLAEWSVNITHWNFPWQYRWLFVAASWFMRVFLHHRKVFCNWYQGTSYSTVTGHNIFGKVFAWGYFNKGNANLNYKDWPIIDSLRVTEDPNVLAGAFYWKRRLVAWFELRRM
jgi:hypothetical protein